MGLIENGSWAPRAAHVMRELLAGSRLTFTETTVTLRSALDESSRAQLDALADELCRDYAPAAQRTDPAALFQIGYGLYVLTTRDGARDNGMIVNTVTQVHDRMVAVTVNKRNFSFDTVRKTGVLNVNCLTVQTPFRVFEQFGFRSGRDVDKFAAMHLTAAPAAKVGTVLVEESPVNLECKVTQVIPLGSHDLFLAECVAVDVDERLLDESGKLCLNKAKLIVYSHGDYLALGRKLGSFGYSVRKKKKIIKK